LLRQFPALAFIVAVSLTGCAGGQSTPSASLSPVTSSSPGVAPSPSVASPSPAAASASPATAALVDPRDGGLDVAFGEFAITMEADTIRPGPIVFVIRNAGALTHGFEMRIDADRSGPGGGDDEFKIETDTFRSGDTVRVETDLPPGRYEIECFVADHDDRGMRTFLEVRRDAPLVAPSGVCRDARLGGDRRLCVPATIARGRGGHRRHLEEHGSGSAYR
jgi:uncharacterized cupredoxin-like copper-binding protein